MKTGTVEFAPDYKSKRTSPHLPKNFGRMEVVCADGQHRFLPGAPTCGCGAEQNLAAERDRLRGIVVEAAKLLRWAELFPAADWPIERERKQLREKVDALIAFEGGCDSEQSKCF